ncbi:MAG: Pyrroline-5-carboxylate reductase [Candidatus Ordinivivax streblomastigis]|uniref:Pyrroline-5-carboxylate reductase n=1 Tax=Candidatus Ordinivivax streblomastigis TaxID=2540710 RepID=A0A5M8NZM2_9BACT|nr:MAG: Pyrroline-5-carboxylate reductase [Candidatus Ordinivivax streblomastigis]
MTRMKLTIIGGGNMGGAIVRGLVQGTIFQASDITVIDVSDAPLKALRDFNPAIRVASSDYNSVATADIVILAVKPWLVQRVVETIRPHLNYANQIIVSIAAGITIDNLNAWLLQENKELSLPCLFRLIPNTAIAVRQSITLISTRNATSKQRDCLVNIFDELGSTVIVDESKLAAGTALTSCGIAYLFRYVRAAMLAGVEMGLYPKEAQNMVVKTMLGAASLLDDTQQNPEIEIDKVTTPGGITIQGLNTLEANGFSDAIIKAMKASR